jgi:hypothetical protein
MMNETRRTIPGESLALSVPPAIRRIANSEDREMAWYFFVFFSRMEYALKRSAYLKKTKPRDDRAEPDWDRFANAHAKEFSPNSSEEVEAAVKFFRIAPPRKQVNNSGVLEWSEPQSKHSSESLLRWVLRAVCTVRNNLFHGGKFPGESVEDPSRDRNLLKHSICILEAALLLDTKVSDHFD